MAKNRKEELKAKEARQKKILGGLVVVLVLVAAIQVPKLMHHNAGNAALVADAATTDTTAAPAPGGTVPPTSAPPTLAGAPGATTGTPAAGSASQLADSSATPAASGGQLVQFGLFASKDPFVQQIVSLADQAAERAGSGSDTGLTTTTPAPTTTAPAAGGGFGRPGSTRPSTPPEPMTLVALISVDGATSKVPAAQDFPSDTPLFHLLSFTADAAKVTIAGGAYADGRSALTLAKGATVTLQNTVDGTQYELVYLGSKKIPTADVTPPPATTTATAPAATAPAPTTTAPAPTTTAPTTTAAP